MEIVKVFTKYDIPYHQINVPFFKPITQREAEELTPVFESPPYDFENYTITRIEQGLEGVRFFHYGR